MWGGERWRVDGRAVLSGEAPAGCSTQWQHWEVKHWCSSKLRLQFSYRLSRKNCAGVQGWSFVHLFYWRTWLHSAVPKLYLQTHANTIALILSCFIFVFSLCLEDVWLKNIELPLMWKGWSLLFSTDWTRGLINLFYLARNKISWRSGVACFSGFNLLSSIEVSLFAFSGRNRTA